MNGRERVWKKAECESGAEGVFRCGIQKDGLPSTTSNLSLSEGESQRRGENLGRL